MSTLPRRAASDCFFTAPRPLGALFFPSIATGQFINLFRWAISAAAAPRLLCSLIPAAAFYVLTQTHYNLSWSIDPLHFTCCSHSHTFCPTSHLFTVRRSYPKFSPVNGDWCQPVTHLPSLTLLSFSAIWTPLHLYLCNSPVTVSLHYYSRLTRPSPKAAIVFNEVNTEQY